MSYRATFRDWISLLGIETPVDTTFAGTMRIADAVTAVRDVRGTYPNVSQDYVAVVDEVADRLAALEPLAEQQGDALAQFAAAVEEIASDLKILRPDWRVPIVRDRLVTATEAARLNAIREEIEVELEAAADKVRQAIAERDLLEQEAADLQDEIEAEQARLDDEEAEKDDRPDDGGRDGLDDNDDDDDDDDDD